MLVLVLTDKLLFAADREHYKVPQWSKCREQLIMWAPRPKGHKHKTIIDLKLREDNEEAGGNCKGQTTKKSIMSPRNDREPTPMTSTT